MRKVISALFILALIISLWSVSKRSEIEVPEAISHAPQSEVKTTRHSSIAEVKSAEQKLAPTPIPAVATGPGTVISGNANAPTPADIKIDVSQTSSSPILVAEKTVQEASSIAELMSQKLDLSDPKKRAEVVAQVRRLEEVQKQETRLKAERLGIPMVIHDPDGTKAILVGFDGDLPRYRTDHNADAAISLGVNLVRSTAPYNVTGGGLKLGLWEVGGVPRISHQEFGPNARVKFADSSTTATSHATHVAGTILGRGIVASALGMAPEAEIAAYDSTNDNSEMLAIGAATANEAGKIYISNHSYGFINGWRPVSATWYGTFIDDGDPANDIETRFGRYDSTSTAMDGMLYNLPYFLPFMSAGNDRNEGPPMVGSTWYLSTGGAGRAYDPSQHPTSDGSYKSGYDLLDSEKVCKNVITIGASNDAVLSGLRNVNASTLTAFSSTGPADDGRIKPDVVANGAGLYSADYTSDTAYSTKSGTSMAAPNASGAALLLIDYFQKRFPGQAMRASTLKGLIIHTADDAGRPGPDYEYGWGLMNTKAAMDLIKTEADISRNQQITEQTLTQGGADTYRFTWDGVSPIRITLCWTDPAGTGSPTHDQRLPDLVNDLNLKLRSPSGSTHLPFVMPYVGNWTNAQLSANAQTGVNTVDNVEQVLIQSPTQAGEYVVTVDHVNQLRDGLQNYSLIISGATWAPVSNVFPETPWVAKGVRGGEITPDSMNYQVVNGADQPFTCSVSVSQTWLQLEASQVTVPARGSANIEVRLKPEAALLPVGTRVASIRFSNAALQFDKLRMMSLTVEPTPRIEVTDSLGETLANGGAAVSHGEINLGSISDRYYYTLKNTVENSTLSLGKFSLSGPDASVFEVGQFPNDTDVTNSAESFYVRFRPRKSGAHSAILNIVSNDPAARPFVINLTGVGQPLPGPTQTITVIQPPTQVRGSTGFQLNAVASSGLDLQYPLFFGPGSIDNNGFITFTGTGAFTMMIRQPGGNGYQAAEPVTISFIVTDKPFQFTQVCSSKVSSSSFAIGTDGSLWSWGSGSTQLGQGDLNARVSPTVIGADFSWQTVTAGGDHTLAIKKDGSLWAWGNNSLRQLGDGTIISNANPVKIGGDQWKVVAAGTSFSVAIRQDGSLWVWGLNSSGQLGLGNTTNVLIPTQVGLETNWLSVVCGTNFVLALKKDGSLWAWGNGANGALGKGGFVNEMSPGRVGSETHWTAIAAGASHALALNQIGEIWSWGGNANGQLGHGDTVNLATPQRVGSSSNFIQITTGRDHTLALKRDGSAWAWGKNLTGQLGDGTTEDRHAPVKINTKMESWASLHGGSAYSAALHADGSLVAWGNGYTGKSIRGLQRTVNPEPWTDMSSTDVHTLLVKENGELWGFGSSSLGQLGTGSIAPHDLQRIGTSNNWSQAWAGWQHSAALDKQGKLWMWGSGLGGLGDGTTSSSYVPKMIMPEASWRKVSHALNQRLAIRDDGTLWGWGYNGQSQLGPNAVATTQLVPVQLVDGTWLDVAAGQTFSYAVRSDGSLWVCGQNTFGQLGLGDYVSRTTWTRVGSSTNWEKVYAGLFWGMGLMKDGSLWAWGDNSKAQLGLGDSVIRLQPVQVGSSKNWKQISTFNYWTAGIQQDGTMWAWGDNNVSQQGVSNTGLVLRPRQISQTSGWVSVAAASNHMVALREDGSLWTSGLDTNYIRTSAGGRSMHAKVAVLPALQTQGVFLTSNGVGGGRFLASSGLPVSVQLISGSATLEGDQFAIAGPSGTSASFLTWQSGDETAWDVALPHPFTVTTQHIEFASIDQQQCGIPLTLKATASGQLPVSYTVTQGADIAQLAGGILTFTAPGQVTVRASQSGNSSFTAAESVSQTFTVIKGSQTLSFATHTPSSISYLETVALDVTSSRGLSPITLSVVEGPGVLEGKTLRFTNSGVVSVKAEQVGTSAFDAAESFINITSINEVATAHSATFYGLEDTVIRGVVTGIDPEGQPLTFSKVRAPSYGTVVVLADGNFTYTPNANFHGRDSFLFKGNDGLIDSHLGVITLEVQSVNDAPEATSQSLNVQNLGPVNLTLSGQDDDGDPLTFVITQSPAHGMLNGNAPNVIYTPNVGYTGPDSFRFKVSDGKAMSEEAVVSIHVSLASITITEPPVSQSVSELDEMNLFVRATGSEPITYQWYKGNEALAGETSHFFRTPSVTQNVSGTYFVKIMNPAGEVSSEAVIVRVVGSKPEIREQSPHQLAIVGSIVTLSVDALGKPPLLYQWKKDGKILAGATQANLVLPSVLLSQAGAYTVDVKSGEIVTSGEIQLGVATSPASELAVDLGKKMAWSIETAGKGLSLEWTRDGVPLIAKKGLTISADKKKVSFKSLESVDSGRYACVVTGPGGELEAGIHILTVLDRSPDITPLKSGDSLPPSQIGHEYVYQVPVDRAEHRLPETFTATGLPAGLKINPAGVISGRATVSSDKDYKVKITARNGSGSDMVDVLLKVARLPENVVGIYAAPIPRHNFNDGLGGRLDLTITTSGAFSGKLTMGSRKAMSFKSGVIKSSLEAGVMPEGEAEIPQIKPLPPLKLHFKVDLATSLMMEARLSDGGTALSFDGWKNVWHAKLQPADALDGLYTTGLEWTTLLTEIEERPVGTGFASFNVSKAGILKLTGKLPDGESLVGSMFVGPQGQILIYQTLYKSSAKGSLAGRMRVGLGANVTDDRDNTLSGLLTWTRPRVSGRLYPQGFGPLSVNVVGGRYIAPQSPAILWGLPDQASNATISFAGAEIADASLNPQISFQISSKHKVLLPKAGSDQNPMSLKLQINPKTGQFKGAFTLSDLPVFTVKAPLKRSVNYQGLIYHGSDGPGGYGYFMLPRLPETSQQAVQKTPIFSGQVILKAP